MSDVLSATGTYADMRQSIKAAVRKSRLRVQRNVKPDLIDLYWTTDHQIVQRQETEGRGNSVVKRLSSDLCHQFPGMHGFSARNLWDMRRLYEEYAGDSELRQLVAEILWGQNLLILNMVKENPSIGIIFCADRNRVEVEYALRGINKPVGVAGYTLTHDLPKELTGKLPDAKQIEAEILRELGAEVDK